MPNWGRVLLLCICALVTSACTDLPDTHVYDRTVPYQYMDKNKLESVGKPENQGREFCSHLETVSRQKSRTHRSWGWSLGALAFLMMALGAGLGAGDVPSDEKWKRIYRVVVVALPVSAAAAAHLSSGQFDMASNANTTAYTAASAVLLDDDRRASAGCNTAIAVWNSNNSISNRAFTEKLLEVMKGEQRPMEVGGIVQPESRPTSGSNVPSVTGSAATN
jgi:hypothetical protein